MSNRPLPYQGDFLEYSGPCSEDHLKGRSQSGLRFEPSDMREWRRGQRRPCLPPPAGPQAAPALGRPRPRFLAFPPLSIIDVKEPGLSHKTCFYESLLLGTTSSLESEKGQRGDTEPPGRAVPVVTPVIPKSLSWVGMRGFQSLITCSPPPLHPEPYPSPPKKLGLF